MSGNRITENNWTRELQASLPTREPNAQEIDAEATLQELAAVFFESKFLAKQSAQNYDHEEPAGDDSGYQPRSVEARYRALVEQIPAVVFMAYLDKGIGEARRLKPHWVFRNTNGSKIRCAGTNRFIPMTNSAGAPKPRRCSFPASR